MAAFEAAKTRFDAADIRVVAVSTDDAEHAAKMVESHALTMPVGFGLDLHETARTLGAFYEERRGILHATGFVLRPTGEIAVASYSTGPIGRLEPDDVVRLVEFYRR